MSLSHEIITLAASANSQIHPSASALPDYSQGVSIVVQNLSVANYVYLGNGNVTASAHGFRLAPNQSITYDLNPFDNLHGIASASGTQIAVTRLFS